MSAWLFGEFKASLLENLNSGLVILHQIEAPKAEAPKLQLPSRNAAKPDMAAPAKPPGANWLEGLGIDASSLTQASPAGGHWPCKKNVCHWSASAFVHSQDVPHPGILLRSLIEGPGHQVS